MYYDIYIIFIPGGPGISEVIYQKAICQNMLYFALDFPLETAETRSDLPPSDPAPTSPICT